MSVLLGPDQLALLAEARRATLATIGPDGRPRLVPCCFALLDRGDGWVFVTAIDDKPKQRADPRTLARVADIGRDPRVTLLVDHWDEDWTRLAWLRLDGGARLLWPESDPGERDAGIGALRWRYPQYRTHALESLPLIWVSVASVRGWAAHPHG
jgi:PPOX class probable F420-dependent enzyme